MPYLLHTSILLTGCFIFYWLLIRKETFFELNRWILITSILLSVTLPLITIPESLSLREIAETKTSINQQPIQTSEQVNSIPQNQAPKLIAQKSAISEETTISEEQSFPVKSVETEHKQAVANPIFNIPLSSILWYLYLTGVGVFLISFLLQLMIILAKKYTLLSFKDGRFKIVELIKDESPYSFWNTIFINPSKYDPGTFEQIIEHEKIHIQQAHFIDKMIAEMLLIAFWFNPFVWMIRKAVSNNLEYLTDSSMLKKGTERQSYQINLLRVSVPQYPLNLSTNYNSSFLKSRIAMMNSKKSSARSSWKYLFLLPLFIFSMVCLNEVQSSVNEIDESSIEQFTDLSPELDQANSNALSNPQAESNSQAAHENHDGFHNHDHSHHSGYNEDLNSEEFKDIDVNELLPPGRWVGEIEGDRVCFELNNSSPAQNWSWVNTECFKKSELSEIPRGAVKDFYIKRTAGTLNLNGSFKDDFGDGSFSFEADKTFVAYLKGEGMEVPRQRDMIHLFFNNVDKNYISYLKTSGFQVDGRDLVELSVHGLDKDRVKEFVQIFKELDHKGYKVRDLLSFQIHEVEPEYVNEIRALGMTDLNVEEIVQAKIHDVEPQFIKAVKDYGYKDIGMQEIIQFSIHDVDIDYINEMKNLGFRDLSLEEIVQASIHDVDPDYIQEMKAAGFKDMNMQELIQFSIHDIDPEYVSALKNAGIKGINQETIVQAGIHDVDPEFIKSLEAYGFGDLDIHEIVQFSIHDVDADFLRDMKAVGFGDLSPEELVQASIHDIDPDYIKELKEGGLENLEMQEIVQFGIHDIDPDDIKAFKASGLNLNNEQIIQAGIHDVSPDYVKDIRALGFDNADFEDLIHASIHDVSPAFIKKAKSKGHNLNTLDEYVELKIRGIN